MCTGYCRSNIVAHGARRFELAALEITAPLAHTKSGLRAVQCVRDFCSSGNVAMDLLPYDGTYLPACALVTLYTECATDGCACTRTTCQVYVICPHSTERPSNDTDDTANIFIQLGVAV